MIRLSLGIGGGFLAAIFTSEAYLHGGFMVEYAVGVFIAVGLCARFFGKVSLRVYSLATLALTVLLIAAGV